MNDEYVKLLCKPCAERLKKLSDRKKKEIKQVSLGANVKITCECCGRRRFGYKYKFADKGLNHE